MGNNNNNNNNKYPNHTQQQNGPVDVQQVVEPKQEEIKKEPVNNNPVPIKNLDREDIHKEPEKVDRDIYKEVINGNKVEKNLLIEYRKKLEKQIAESRNASEKGVLSDKVKAIVKAINDYNITKSNTVARESSGKQLSDRDLRKNVFGNSINDSGKNRVSVTF